MNLYVRFCKECGIGFDIDISKELCPKCREKKQKESKKEKRNKGDFFN